MVRAAFNTYHTGVLVRGAVALAIPGPSLHRADDEESKSSAAQGQRVTATIRLIVGANLLGSASICLLA